MALELQVLKELKDSLLNESVNDALTFVNNVRAFTEKVGQSDPDLIILQDDGENSSTIEKIANYHNRFPKASIFIISRDQSPEHIVEIMKSGATEYFLAPINPQKVGEAVGRVQKRRFEESCSRAAAIYAFLGTKGGLGTSFLTVNTAAAIAARKDGKTAVLDQNLQAGDSGVLLDVVPKTTLADVARNHHRLDASILLGTMEQTAVGLDLLAAPTALEDEHLITPEVVTRVLQLAKGMYDYLLVDCPSRAADPRVLEALRVAAKVFLVTDLSVPAIRNTSRLMKILPRIGAGHLEVVVNRFVKGQASTLDEVEKTLGRRIFWLFPNNYETAIESINRGTPLVKYDPRSTLARSFTEFAQKLQDPSASSQYRGVRGLLGKAV